MNRLDALRESLGRHRLAAAVAGTALLASAIRLYALGRRVFYFDEAWFGYWVLKSMDTGAWHYRPIVHGPFFARVNSVVFSVLGATDVTARLVVALVGGLLPLSAWLFRERLRESEVVALALFLAANPILVYYSRFMRNDLLLGAFSLFALGFAVRALDTRRPRYVYAATLSFALAFTTKESVLLYVLTALGAGALVFDDRILRRSGAAGGARAAVAAHLRTARRGLAGWWHHVLGSIAAFLVVVVYFYAPRPELWNALADPTRLPGVVEAATTGSLSVALDHWVLGGKQGHPYIPYLLDTLRTLWGGAPALSILAVGGFLVDRYAGESGRALVAFTFYSGVAAVLGYPLANNFPVPWSTIHAVVPLAIPAAVGAGALYRWGRGKATLAGEESGGSVLWARARAGIVAVVLVVAAVNAGLVTAETSYRDPHESPVGGDGHEVVYYAQPPGNLSAVTAAIRRVARDGGEDADVLYVGGALAGDEDSMERPPPAPAWYARIPLPWYTEAAGADVESVGGPWAIGTDPPPVVITTMEDYERVGELLPEAYSATYHPLDDMGGREVVVFVEGGLRAGDAGSS